MSLLIKPVPFGGTAHRFARCNDLFASGQTEEIWSDIELNVSMDEDLRVSVTRAFGFNSYQYEKNCSPISDIEMVPLPIGMSESLSKPILLASLYESRELRPAPSYSLVRILGQAVPQVADTAAIPMRRSEYMSFPEVRVISTKPSAHERKKSFSLRQVLPVSALGTTFDAPTSIPRLLISKPDFVSVDNVAMRCRINWLRQAKGIKKAVDEILSQVGYSDAVKANLIFEVSNQAYAEVNGTILSLTKLVKECVKTVEGPWWRTRLLKDPVLASWTTGLDEFANRLNVWSVKWPATSILSLDSSIKSATELQGILASADVPFALVASIDADGSVDLRRVLQGLRNFADQIYVHLLKIPLTTELEPGTLGKRASLLLFLLGTILLGVAAIDVRWIPFDSIEGSVRNFINLDPPESDAVRGALVALLTIFPAALYAQFFQSRPRTPVGYRAQLGTFAALSMLFALPIIPALLATIGTSLAHVAGVCALLSVFSIGIGAALWMTYSERSLARLRRSQIRKSADLRLGGGESRGNGS